MMCVNKDNMSGGVSAMTYISWRQPMVWQKRNNTLRGDSSVGQCRK